MNNPVSNNLAERAQACLDMGDLQQAIKLFGELRDNEPNNAEAWLMSGALLGETGATEEAETFIQKAVTINPNYPEAHLTLAYLQKATGALEDSYDSTKTALEIDSNYDEAWVYLGAICCDLCRFEEAENACREAIKRWPENAQAHICLATALCALGREHEAEPVAYRAIGLDGAAKSAITPLLGRILLGKCEYDEAESLIRSALAASPNDVVLMMSLANIKLGQKQLDQAEEIFHKITDQAPEMADAWTGLGVTYQNQHKSVRAEECYRKAIELDASSIPPVYKLAQLQEINGQFSDAEDAFRGILEQYPGSLDTVGALAGLLEKAGRIDDAIDTLEPVLSIPERSVPVALALQKLCKKMNRCDDAVNYLNDVLQTSYLQVDDEIAARFALGALYDKQGQFDNAFNQFLRANDLRKQAYDPDDYTIYINNMIDTCSQSLLDALPVASSASEQPVFIVGMPRSGTSLIEKILSSHSDVYGAGELREITAITENLTQTETGGFFPGSMSNLTQDDIDRFSEGYLDLINRISNGALRVTDKLPHNFQYIGLIHALFPGAKIIHCLRDAKDTCLSCYSMNFFGYHPYTSNLEALGRHYKDYERLMKHWREIDIPMLEVHYEDLVDDPEKWTRKLLEYCDLGWQDQCLRFYENGSMTRTASYDQVRQPMYKNSIGRWKNYIHHLRSLTDVLDY